MRILLFLISLILFSAAEAQRQGIKGQVFWLSGNQMPGPDKGKSPQQGIVREIHIYNAANLSDATSQGGFYSEIKTSFVQKVTSNPDGSFLVKLPQGRYSLFVKEPQGLFANTFDGQGCINCISVRKKKYSWITIVVDYEAAY
ncbi:MAG TPA: carboxypeptidase regulatory-like domain-containing protein [Ohtaekwangia sp.]